MLILKKNAKHQNNRVEGENTLTMRRSSEDATAGRRKELRNIVQESGCKQEEPAFKDFDRPCMGTHVQCSMFGLALTAQCL